ncbi:MAG: crossover junction endodeoxyribonuclease RuvC [Rickettsiales bacterium]|jgi:crossover junction endodeoxyribonuclease RuvC|nr:crossover junction endodeoxyribonuclease RuvC [Rickettsiales bacterium]
MTLILGIDPGLRFTGYGIIDCENGRLRHVANGTIRISEKLPMPERLAAIHRGLSKVLEEHSPDEAAVEEAFVNMNPSSTLRLGQARGVALLTPGLFGVPVYEYSPNLVKKSVVGAGHAAKEQIGMMVGVLLGRPKVDSEHSADALAIAICHAHNRTAPE